MSNETISPGVGRLFLSYARDDDKTFVAKLYQRLRDEGFDVWWDMADMPSRGLTFLDTNVGPLPDENAAARVIELARTGNLDAAHAELDQIRMPRARARALMSIARHEPIASTARLCWINAMLCARKVGRRQLDEVLATGQEGLDSALFRTIETLDARWSSSEV